MTRAARRAIDAATAIDASERLRRCNALIAAALTVLDDMIIDTSDALDDDFDTVRAHLLDALQASGADQ